jgi:hypothetical protein
MSNYQAIIAKVDAVAPIPGADKIQIAKVLGETVVVSIDTPVGYVGVFFCPGTKLEESYCHNNNLYRHALKNIDPNKTGFFEDAGRVRAQPFLKIKSEGYFATLESLAYTGIDISSLKVGDKFEELNGVKICTKYISEATAAKIKEQKNKPPKVSLTPYFKEHVDTEQFKYDVHKINKGDLISIQSKRHGTSQRVGYTKTIKTLKGWRKWVNKLVPVFKTEGYEYVVGTRRVVLGGPDKVGFHGSEAYRFEILEQLKPYLTKGMEIYLEVVGWANGKTIMPKHNISKLKDKAYTAKYGDEIVYKYGCLEGQYKFHIYRITLTTDDGNAIDFTQPQLVAWCKDRGLDVAPDVIDPFIYDGDEGKLRYLVEVLTERPEVLTEDYHDPSHISEGVIVRVDRFTQTPLFLKSKSYAFRVLEGLAEVEDPEDAA